MVNLTNLFVEVANSDCMLQILNDENPTFLKISANTNKLLLINLRQYAVNFLVINTCFGQLMRCLLHSVTFEFWMLLLEKGRQSFLSLFGNVVLEFFSLTCSYLCHFNWSAAIRYWSQKPFPLTATANWKSASLAVKTKCQAKETLLHTMEVHRTQKLSISAMKW